MTILRDLRARHYAIFRTAGEHSTITACGLNNADANLYELTTREQEVTCRLCRQDLGLPMEPDEQIRREQRRAHELSTIDPRVHYSRIGEDSKARSACNLEYRGAFFSTADGREVTCLLCRRAIDPLATVAYKSSMTIAPTPTITPTTITPTTLPDGARVRILPFAEIPLGGVFEVAFDQAMDGSLPNFYFDLEQRARKHAPRRFHVEYRDPTAPPDTPLPQSLRVWRIE